MGSHIDLYVLTDRRTSVTIELFLAAFTNRPAIENLKEEELMLLPKGKSGKELTHTDNYIWKKAGTLTEAIDTGLAEPGNCFTLYLISNHPEIDQVMITFTKDGKLILGLSIPECKDEEQTNANYHLAKQLAMKIQQEYGGRMSYFERESPPMHTEREFDAAMKACNAGINQ